MKFKKPDNEPEIEESLPSRERGLKSVIYRYGEGGATVAPLAGAWIEISTHRHTHSPPLVAPLAGAWIEIPGKST